MDPWFRIRAAEGRRSVNFEGMSQRSIVTEFCPTVYRFSQGLNVFNRHFFMVLCFITLEVASSDYVAGKMFWIILIYQLASKSEQSGPLLGQLYNMGWGILRSNHSWFYLPFAVDTFLYVFIFEWRKAVWNHLPVLLEHVNCVFLVFLSFFLPSVIYIAPGTIIQYRSWSFWKSPNYTIELS